MPDVYVKGNRVRLSPSKVIGQGGEAVIYDVGSGLVLKLYKEPQHPDYHGQADEREGARLRLKTHQQKLPAFPKNLPSRVIAPLELATDKNGKIVGYLMKRVENSEVLLRYREKKFRQAGVDANEVLEIFRDLHGTVDGVHEKKVVIGDFNDLNVMVNGTKAYLVDADSMQFAKFLCQVFTARFVDPLLCDPKASSLQLKKPHNVNSDWYAFAIMLMQSLLFVDPYGGIYRPKDKQKRVLHGQRPLKRITVFNSEVVYPKPAIHYSALPDELLQFFLELFHKDWRGQFPRLLLDSVRFTRCSNCSLEHARATCPNCKQVSLEAIKATISVRGQVRAERIFRLKSGLILTSAMQKGKLRWLYHQDGAFHREDKKELAKQALNPQMRFRIQDEKTLIGRNGSIRVYSPTEATQRIQTESYGLLPVFDANSSSQYWINNGQLLKSGSFGSEYVGDVLSNRTLIWLGEELGFGFYRAGKLFNPFLFSTKKRGINDSFKLKPILGQLVDANCVFGKDKIWFFYASREQGQTKNHCTLIDSKGSVLATASAEEGDGSWLENIRGKCGAGSYLFSPSDQGIVRLELVGSSIVKTKEFPDTEPFVNSQSQLVAGPKGIYVVDSREITLLQFIKKE